MKDDPRPASATRKRPRGKSIALASACTAVVLVAVAIWVSRGWLLETWYLHRLESEHEETRLAAVEKLGELGSLRAVPKLLEVFCAENREHVHQRWFSVGSSDDLYGLWVGLTPVLYAVYQAGPRGGALVRVQRDRLKESLSSTDFVTDNQGSFRMMRRSRALSFLLEAWERDLPVSRISYDDNPWLWRQMPEDGRAAMSMKVIDMESIDLPPDDDSS